MLHKDMLANDIFGMLFFPYFAHTWKLTAWFGFVSMGICSLHSLMGYSNGTDLLSSHIKPVLVEE